MTIYPNVGAMKLAQVVASDLGGGELHLFKAIDPPLSAATVVADLEEADYAGYANKDIAAMNAPYLDPAGGASIQTGSQQFDWGPGPGSGNVVLGWYLLDTDGDLFAVGVFDEPIAMNALGDAIPLNLTFNYGAT